MAWTVIQAGTSLQFLDTSGTLTTLTLPTGITLRDDVPPRWTSYGQFVILVNTPNRPITIDRTGTVRPLTPLTPRFAPTLSGASGGTLSGTFKVKDTFITLDANGAVISESDFSPASNPATISTQYLKADNIDVSPDTITARRLYRTTDGTDTYFHWIDLYGNVLTSIQDDLSDAALAPFAAPSLGAPPRLTLIAQFRDRLWGVGDIDKDHVRYTEVGTTYAWPDDNEFPVPPVGSDTVGVTALMPRKDYLGMGRLNRLLQLSGTDDDDFRIIVLSENCGVLSQESVAVYRDTVYFLWFDGVYKWDDNGLDCISDGKVRTWFTTSDYFDQDTFANAFGVVDPIRNKYRLFLDDPDGNKRWVEYDINTKTWWGPHKCHSFTSKSTFIILNEANKKIPVIGGTYGGIYEEQTTATDTAISGDFNGIEFDVDTKPFTLDPEYEHFWGELSFVGRSQPNEHNGILTVTPHVGYVGAAAGTPLYHDMKNGRERLGRLGVGQTAQLNLTHDGPDEPVEVWGIEIPKVNIVGRR